MEQRIFPKKPLIGVGAVVFKGDCVLLVRRGNPPLAGSWSLPGGGIGPAETLPQAVEREVREECGIDVEVVDLVKEFEYREKTADGRVRYHYIVFDFKAAYRSGTLGHSSDALDARWVPLDRLGEYELTAAVREVIKKAMGMG
jgi:8-oxo-dGTP diphosphatase